MPQHTSLFEACSVVPNADAISDAAENEGYINVSPDADGVLRWAPLAIKMDRELYPSLALSALVQYLDWPVFSITLKDSGVEGIKLGDIDIPTDPLGRILINYRGPEKSFPHYSISDLLNDRIDADAIRDKIVLVGLSDQSLGTSRLTPYGTAYTDVEIQANVIDNILHGNIIRRPSWAGLFDLSSILLFGLILSAVFAKIHWFPSMLLSAALIVLVVSGGAYMLQAHGLWLSIAYPLLAIVATYLGVVISKGMIKKSQVTRT